MAQTVIGLLHPGEMGAAVGAILRDRTPRLADPTDDVLDGIMRALAVRAEAREETLG